MSVVTAFKAKTTLGALIERVAKGEEVIITRYNRPVARLVSERPRDLKLICAAVTSLRTLRQQIAKRNEGKSNVTMADIKLWITEGRR